MIPGPLLSRLLGLETEYAIRYTSEDAAKARPSNLLIFRSIATALQRRFDVFPGQRTIQHQLFLENGGALYYEFLPHAPDGGLLEAATPECMGPAQLLVYQRAEEEMLHDASLEAERMLAAAGYKGELGLLKNCRDAEGHTYGAQENYEADIASGLGLFFYRAALLALLPLVFLTPLFLTMLLLPMLAVGVLAAPIEAQIARRCSPQMQATLRRFGILDEDAGRLIRKLRRISVRAEIYGGLPMFVPFTLFTRLFTFRRVRRDLLAFLVTRPIFSGAGSVGDPKVDGGFFFLAEKARAITRIVRTSVDPESRPIFDTGNLYKELMGPLLGHGLSPLRQLWRPRQRLQLGLADANMCEFAEYLKLATTCLVIDLSERGKLGPVPRLWRPIAALRAVNGDPLLRAKIGVIGGGAMTALEVQGAYLAAVERAIAADPSEATPEVQRVIAAWRETLDALGGDPASLFGKIDWVTKLALVNAVGPAERLEVQKKIDLKYHELGNGYHAELERAGHATRLTEAEEVTRGVSIPPPGSPAERRSRILRTLSRRSSTLFASWREATVGEGNRTRVVRYEDEDPTPRRD